MAIKIGKYSKSNMKRNLAVGVNPNRSVSSKTVIVNSFINTKRNYSLNLKKTFKDFTDGKIDKDKYLDLQKNNIKQAFNDSYLLGKLYSQNTETSITQQEERMLNTLVRSELDFMERFANDVINKQGKMSYTKRLNMYVNSLVAVFTSGKMAYIPEDSIIYWKLGSNDKHCVTCLSLSANSPYTKKNLPTVPKAGHTQCLSNCNCYLEYEYNDDYVDFILKNAVANGRNNIPDQIFYETLKSWTEDYYYYRGLYELTKQPKFISYSTNIKQQLKTYIKFNNYSLNLNLPLKRYINDLKKFIAHKDFILVNDLNQLKDNDIISIHYNGNQVYGKIKVDMNGNLTCKTLTGKIIELNLNKMILFVDRTS